MKLSKIELLSVGVLVAYVAFFTRPPHQFVTTVLEHPVGQAVVLAGVLYVASQKSLVVGLFLAIAYLTSSFTTLEYLDEKEQTPKEQPKSGAPKVDAEQIGKLASILAGPGGKLPTEKGKDVKEPPPSKTAVKPHSDPKVTEKFSVF
jgi:hypothetical protein